MFPFLSTWKAMQDPCFPFPLISPVPLSAPTPSFKRLHTTIRRAVRKVPVLIHCGVLDGPSTPLQPVRRDCCLVSNSTNPEISPFKLYTSYLSTKAVTKHQYLWYFPFVESMQARAMHHSFNYSANQSKISPSILSTFSLSLFQFIHSSGQIFVIFSH